MATPIAYTDVADAFEAGDPFDVNVQLNYTRSITKGTIKREILDSTAQDGRASHHLVSVAQHSRAKNDLSLRLEIGIYRDLMVFLRMPIVLGDDNELRPSDAPCTPASEAPSCVVLRESVPAGTARSQMPLFDLSQTLASARRSGLPSIDFGVAFAVTNQYRTPHMATWVLIVEGSADTGAVMRPCLEGQESCRPGISRGTTRLQLESRWSYRYRYVEPFMGVSHTFEWIASGEDVFRSAGRLPGVVDEGPPSTTDGRLGAAAIPWEDRARYQRFEIDAWAEAALISAGRDYSPLFDALGASTNPHLTQPNADRLTGPRRPVPFTGLTNVEAHARLALESQVVMQAARYVRFALGIGLSYLSSHLITGAPACDAAVAPSASDQGTTSCDAGSFNPVYRPAIDAPSKRFRLDSEVTLRLQASAMAMF